jgi:hypothetical protein
MILPCAVSLFIFFYYWGEQIDHWRDNLKV